VNPGVLIFAVLFGIAGYSEANRYLKRYGRTPFGWPAIVWGVVCFLSFLLGVILLAIGERIIRNRAAETPMYGGSYSQPVNAAPPAYGPPVQTAPWAPPPQQTPTYGLPVQPPQPPPSLNGDILPK